VFAACRLHASATQGMPEYRHRSARPSLRLPWVLHPLSGANGLAPVPACGAPPPEYRGSSSEYRAPHTRVLGAFSVLNWTGGKRVWRHPCRPALDSSGGPLSL
jgi:hypothetical protein